MNINKVMVPNTAIALLAVIFIFVLTVFAQALTRFSVAKKDRNSTKRTIDEYAPAVLTDIMILGDDREVFHAVTEA